MAAFGGVHSGLAEILTIERSLDSGVTCHLELWKNASYRLSRRAQQRMGCSAIDVNLSQFEDSFLRLEALGIGVTGKIFRQELLRLGELFRNKQEEVAAVDVFIASMMWGNGTTGYGRYRTSIALEISRGGRNPTKTLEEVASLASNGDLAKAYRLMTNSLWRIGPAFGTKFLYFVSPPASNALIFDGVVAGWNGSELPWPTGKATAWWWNWSTYKEYCDWCEEQFSVLVASGFFQGRTSFRPDGEFAPDFIEASIFAFENQ
jgi:hypothetical protein